MWIFSQLWRIRIDKTTTRQQQDNDKTATKQRHDSDKTATKQRHDNDTTTTRSLYDYTVSPPICRQGCSPGCPGWTEGALNTNPFFPLKGAIK
jgi:hypothetical protein